MLVYGVVIYMMLCHDVACSANVFNVMIGYVLLWCSMLPSVMSWYNMVCSVMLCHALLCHVIDMLCSVM